MLACVQCMYNRARQSCTCVPCLNAAVMVLMQAACDHAMRSNCYCYSLNIIDNSGYCVPGYKTVGEITVDFSTASGDPCADAMRKVRNLACLARPCFMSARHLTACSNITCQHSRCAGLAACAAAEAACMTPGHLLISPRLDDSAISGVTHR